MTILAGLITAGVVVGLGYATRQGRSFPFYSTVLIVMDHSAESSTMDTAADDHLHHDENDHGGHDHDDQNHHAHHAAVVEDFRRRFWVSSVGTLPILALSPMLQQWLGVGEAFAFPGDTGVLLALATFVYGYGGWPFLTGLVDELRDRTPGMTTLVALAISVAYAYSAAVALGVPGKMLFWETATLIDLMLLGHWIEMRSVMGASRALEELARLMPSTAHRLTDDGDTEEVPIATLAAGDRVRVKSGEKIPADGTVADGTSNVNESMLTGDNERVAHWGAEELGLDRVIAEVLPDEKSQVINDLQAEGRLVAMTGDGVNDAPALATADVDIAILMSLSTVIVAVNARFLRLS